MRYSKVGTIAILLAVAATTAGCGWGYYADGEEGTPTQAGRAAASAGTEYQKLADTKPETELLIEEVKDEAMTGTFKTTLETVNQDGRLKIDFSLQNTSGKDVMIEHGSGQQYDIHVYNDQDEEVYRWSHQRAFTLALITRELKAGDQLSFEETWNGTNNEETPLPAGDYTLKVTIAVRAVSGTVDAEELTAETKIKLPLST